MQEPARLSLAQFHEWEEIASAYFHFIAIDPQKSAVAEAGRYLRFP